LEWGLGGQWGGGRGRRGTVENNQAEVMIGGVGFTQQSGKDQVEKRVVKEFMIDYVEY